MNFLEKLIRKKSYRSPIGQDEWLQLVEKSYPNGLTEPGLILPSFPNETIQANTVGCVGKMAIQQAYEFYRIANDTLAKKNKSKEDNPTILDFGCGWGRITRFFLNNTQKENIYGVDVEKDFIEICRSSFNSPNFLQSHPLPPTTFEDNKFDLITLYSVFSHLNETTCKKWITEFSRILKPKGSIIFTTRSVEFFDYCQRLSNATSSYEKALANLFNDFDSARKSYEEGNFIFSGAQGVGGGGAMNTSFYGESFIPEKYILDHYCQDELFSGLERIRPHGYIDQEIFILHK